MRLGKVKRRDERGAHQENVFQGFGNYITADDGVETVVDFYSFLLRSGIHTSKLEISLRALQTERTVITRRNNDLQIENGYRRRP